MEKQKRTNKARIFGEVRAGIYASVWNFLSSKLNRVNYVRNVYISSACGLQQAITTILFSLFPVDLVYRMWRIHAVYIIKFALELVQS